MATGVIESFAVEIKRWNPKRNQQRVEIGNRRYVVQNLWDQAKDLPVQVMSMSALNIYGLGPKIDEDIREFVGHMKAVLEADLDYPIILDPDGYIMDGRHRVAKALLQGEKTIKFVRFVDEPEWDYTEEPEE